MTVLFGASLAMPTGQAFVPDCLQSGQGFPDCVIRLEPWGPEYCRFYCDGEPSVVVDGILENPIPDVTIGHIVRCRIDVGANFFIVEQFSTSASSCLVGSWRETVLSVATCSSQAVCDDLPKPNVITLPLVICGHDHDIYVIDQHRGRTWIPERTSSQCEFP